jgi:KDO2-lipid IV(A) lauroyltransferase
MSQEEVEGEGQRIVWKKGRKRKRSRFRKALSRNLGYVQIRCLHAVLCRLPRPVGRALAWVVGTALYYVLGRERRIALDGLTRVYGAEKSPREIRSLARAVFRHTVHVVIDWVIIRRWSRERAERRFPDAAQGCRELLEMHRAIGTGVVGITGHFGNWELMTVFFEHFFPRTLIPVAKSFYFPKYQDFIHRLRTSPGNDIIYTHESPRRIIRAIKEGKIVGFLPDQDVRTNSGVFVDFFGLPAYTVTAPVHLARKLRVPLVIVLVVRKDTGYKIVFSDPLDAPYTDDEAADLLAGTQLWTRFLEEQIRTAPEQWAWLHPRWRTKPGSPRKFVDRSKRASRRP